MPTILVVGQLVSSSVSVEETTRCGVSAASLA